MMNGRYYVEIADGLSTHYCFSYIDTLDNLADFLFDHLKIDVEREMEFHYDDDPFKIVMCHIPRQQRAAFLRAVGLLPALMAYAGQEGYDEYCMDFMLNAARYMKNRQETQGITPLQ